MKGVAAAGYPSVMLLAIQHATGAGLLDIQQMRACAGEIPWHGS
jgi:hypothetical protein